MEYAEIAQILQRTEATIRSQMFHALAGMRRHLEPRTAAERGKIAMIKPEEHVLEYVDAYLHERSFSAGAKSGSPHTAGRAHLPRGLGGGPKTSGSLGFVAAGRGLARLGPADLWTASSSTRRRSRWIVAGLSAAAAVVVLLGAANLYYYNLAPSPYDLRVLGQSELVAGSRPRSACSCWDPCMRAAAGRRAGGIELVRAEPAAVVHLASFTTDQFGSGTVRMQMPDWAPGRYKLRVSAGPAGRRSRSSRAITLRRSWQLMLTSDKPVYQPGQVIHLRSLALARPQSKPVAGHEAVFSVTDAKGNVIFRQRDVTSRFGISSADCPLADEILEGAYQVRCELGDTTSTITVEVKKYVLPKFKIAVELDEPYYQPGQKVRGTLSARYFFGKPVRRTARSRSRSWPTTSRRATSPGRRPKTDARGTAPFEFVLPPSLVGRPQDGGDARFHAHSHRADSAGQKQSASVSRIVTAEPIRIEVIPEAGRLVPRPAQHDLLPDDLCRRPAGRGADRGQRLRGRDQDQRHGRGLDRVHAAGRLGPLDRPRHGPGGPKRPPRGDAGVRPARRAVPRSHRQGGLRRRPDGPHPGPGGRQRTALPRPDQGRPDHAHRYDRHGQGPRRVPDRPPAGGLRHAATLRLPVRARGPAGDADPGDLRPAGRRPEDRRPARSARVPAGPAGEADASRSPTPRASRCPAR